MVALAIADNPAFVVSRAEVDRDGPSYAVDTLEGFVAEARAAGADPDLTFILSAEAYAGLPAWHRPERVLELARMAVVPRPGAPVVDLAAMAARVRGARDRTTLIDGPLLAVSGLGDPGPGRRGPVDPVPGPGCGRRATSATMACTPSAPPIDDRPAHRGSRRRDRPRRPPAKPTRPRPPGEARRPEGPAGPARPRHPPSRATAGPRRWTSPGGSSSWPRRRRRPTS